ncbi:enamine deaminase RidA [Photorhabdus luminescens]|uniref:RidA family protein n=1 Tax=Photorhabdus akhurstii TaxID=171438 RepID=UPI000CF9323E|nr:enamine deaminase RidA [Photorhabdus luminescens]PQQ34052.1 enamine deaminase RidA [Photorhabdus luminescens]
MMQILQPSGWVRPKGYANGIAARGTMIFISGQFGWDAEEKLVSDDYAEQAIQALTNIVTILEQAEAGPEHLVRLTWYVSDREAWLAAAKTVGRAYRELIGHFPVMSTFQVVTLMVPGAKVQIEATAVVPD